MILWRVQALKTFVQKLTALRHLYCLQCYKLLCRFWGLQKACMAGLGCDTFRKLWYKNFYECWIFVSAAKTGDSVCFRSQCVSTPTAAVIDIDILSLEVHSTSIAATRPMTYVGAIGLPMKVRVGFSWSVVENGLFFFTRLNSYIGLFMINSLIWIY